MLQSDCILLIPFTTLPIKEAKLQLIFLQRRKCIHMWNIFEFWSRDLHRVPKTKKTRPDSNPKPDRVRVRVWKSILFGFGSGLGPKNFFRVGFGLKILLFTGLCFEVQFLRKSTYCCFLGAWSWPPKWEANKKDPEFQKSFVCTSQKKKN